MSKDWRSALPRDADWALSLLSLVGLGVVAVLYWLNSSRPAAAHESTQAVGKLSFAMMEVRHRPAGTLVWEGVAPGADLYEEDALYAASGSAATVTLNDGSRLELDEGSLILLERPSPRSEGASSVVLLKGSVSGTAGAHGAEVAIGGTIARLASAAQAKISVGSNRHAEIQVFDGSATLRTASDQATLGASESASTGADGKLRRAAPPAASLEVPSRNYRVFFVQSPPALQLRWTRLSAEALRLQVAKDRNFTRIVVDQPAPEGEATFLPPSAGLFFWRLADLKGLARSEARKLAVIEDLPPLPIAPAAGELVFAPPGTPLPFAWSPLFGVSHYRLEVSPSPSFASLSFSEEAQAPGFWSRRMIPEGTYYWRVRAVEPARGSSPLSQTASFRLITKPLPDAPELLDPQLEIENVARAP